MMKAILIPVVGDMSVVEVDGTLADYYRVLECTMIEEARAIDLGVNLAVIGDEEAKLTNRPVNVRLTAVYPHFPHDVFAGPGLVVGVNNGSFSTVPDPEIRLDVLTLMFSVLEREADTSPYVKWVRDFNAQLESGERSYF